VGARTASELLFDSEASLRLVDSAIVELKPNVAENGSADGGPVSGSDVFGRLPQKLLRAYSEIGAILERLRVSRGVLEQASMDKLAHMHDKLKEVTSATETAATDILNGLDRSVAMVDELDHLAELPDSAARAAEVRSTMRDELFGLMNHLQFQDITTQQLAYASSVIMDMEDRLAQLIKLFDPSTMSVEMAHTAPPLGTAFDPNASNGDAAERQALADSLFGSNG
jgi:chemotaxis regulatin CheY-phosphate phosphatase CheZ